MRIGKRLGILMVSLLIGSCTTPMRQAGIQMVPYDRDTEYAITPRESDFKESGTMATYETIKELVLEAYASLGRMPSYEKLTSLVRTHFPDSKWQKTHYAWYKSQIKTGKMPVPSQEADLSDESDEAEPDVEQEVQESLAFSVSMEKDLQLFVSMNLALVEPGLVLHDDGVEFQTDAGRIDLLASDNNNDLVVLELKVGRANDATLGQILGYMGALEEASDSGSRRIRGIIVASDFDSRLQLAVKHLPTISLVRYELAFQFESVT